MTFKFLAYLFLILFLTILGCGKGGDEKTADQQDEQSTSNENTLEGMQKNFEKMGEQLKGGKNVQTVDFRELKALLPESLPGMKRTNASGEKTSAFGMNVSQSKGDYSTEDGSKRIDITLTDIGSMTGLAGMAVFGWYYADLDRETDTGYERTTKFNGYKAYEEYNNQNKSGKIQVLVGDRFWIEADGDGVSMDEIKNALGNINFGKLESMKNFGVE